MAGVLTVSQYQNFTSAYMGTVVGASGAYGVIVRLPYVSYMLN
jgi:hypothetical protein